MRRWWGRRCSLLVFALLAAYVMVWAFGGFASRLILFPTTQPMEAGAARRELMPFEAGHLEAWVARSPGAERGPPAAYLIVFAGNADRAERHAERDALPWGDRAVEVWAVNHPGYGGSTGLARLARLAPAALAAFDHVQAQAAGKPVLVAGTSLGATTALHVAAHRPVAGLILRTPPPFRQLIMGQFGWWNAWLLATPVAFGVPRSLDASACAKQATCPAVFLLLDEDRLVPVAYQERVHDAYAGPKALVRSEHGDHNDVPTPGAQRALADRLDWLWREAVDPR